ncbi:MAG: hypothetical protein Q9162_005686 [Coniocarpon cinnabarinum]
MLQGFRYLIGWTLPTFSKPPGAEVLQWVKRLPNDGLIFFKWFIYRDGLVLTSPATLQEVLVSKARDFEKPLPLRRFLSRSFVGDGLIATEGALHREQRRYLAPLFHPSQVTKFQGVFWTKGSDMVQGMRSELQRPHSTIKGAIDIGRWTSLTMFDIIGIYTLGTDFNTLQSPDHRLLQLLGKLLTPTSTLAIYFALQHILPSRLVNSIPFLSRNAQRVVDHDMNEARQIVLDIVQEQRSKGMASNLDVVSELCRSVSISDTTIMNQVFATLIAGHETTANTFVWACLLLTKRVDIQDKIREELAGIIDQETVDFALLKQLPVLNGTLNEALRLYPGIPVCQREAIRNTSIQGVAVPRGTTILIVPWAIHRSEHVWGSGAEDFRPERWIQHGDEDGRGPPPDKVGSAARTSAFQTFLQGPHTCIGNDFAKAELRCLIAQVVRNFRIGLAADMNEDKLVPNGVVTIKPRTPLLLKLEELT